MDKDIVRARFAKAVRSYDDNAHVQRQIAGYLCHLMAEYGLGLHGHGAKDSEFEVLSTVLRSADQELKAVVYAGRSSGARTDRIPARRC